MPKLDSPDVGRTVALADGRRGELVAVSGRTARVRFADYTEADVTRKDFVRFLSPRRLFIQPSNVDLKAPEGVTVMYRLETLHGGRQSPPRKISDHENRDEAQAASNAMKDPHGFMTWWRGPDGRRVNKHFAMNDGTRRYFRVSVPWSAEANDETLKAAIQEALKGLAGVRVAVLPKDQRPADTPARVLAKELAVLANSGVVPCSEGYGPVWEKWEQLDAALAALEQKEER